jgi:hypothetical protein
LTIASIRSARASVSIAASVGRVERERGEPTRIEPVDARAARPPSRSVTATWSSPSELFAGGRDGTADPTRADHHHPHGPSR